MKWDAIQQSLGITIPGSQATITADVNGQSASGMGVDLAVTYLPLTGLSLGLELQLERFGRGYGCLLQRAVALPQGESYRPHRLTRVWRTLNTPYRSEPLGGAAQ